MKYEVKKKFLSLGEMTEVVNNAVDICFIKDDEGNDVDYVPEYKEVSLNAAFCEKYLGLELSEDFDEAYNVYMNVDIYGYLDEINKDQWRSIEIAISNKVEFRKAKLLQPKSELDDMFKTFNNLLETANSKLAELDVKTFEKIAKKLNVKELVKAYQTSGIGEGVRDETIAQLSKELKETKNKLATATLKVQ